jgi:hypothetical protein
MANALVVHKDTRKNTEPEWLLRCKVGTPPGWIVALRLREDNGTVLDHILLRSSFMKGTWLRFMDKTRERRKIESYEAFEELARSLLRRLNVALRSVLRDRAQLEP